MPKMVERKCANRRCGLTFTARSADVARGWARFCSKSCKAVVQEARTGQHARHLHGGGSISPDDDVDYEGGGFYDYKGISGSTGHLDGKQ